MPNQHKTPGISWHSADPDLKPWIDAEAERRGTTRTEILDEALFKYRAAREYDRSVDARTANREIAAGLNERTGEAT